MFVNTLTGLNQLILIRGYCYGAVFNPVAKINDEYRAAMSDEYRSAKIQNFNF